MATAKEEKAPSASTPRAKGNKGSGAKHKANGGTAQGALDAALGYATAYGWYIFPTPPGEKKSYKAAEHSDGRKWGMTKDPDEVRRDFARWPDAGIGVPTGYVNGIFVVDVDTLAGHGVDGLAALRDLEAAHGPLPETLMAESPSGSLHYYFKHPGPSFKVKSTDGALGPGIDVKGDGGMVLAPPTMRPGAGAYRWRNDAPIAEPPQWLLDLVIAQKAQATGERAEAEADEGRVAVALACIPNNDLHWNEWNRIAMATWAATGGSEFGLAVFDVWSQKFKEKYNAANTAAKWATLASSPPDEIGAGTLFHLADEAYEDDPNINAKIEAFMRAMGVKYENDDEQETSDEQQQQQQDASKQQQPKWRAALPLIDISKWDDEPVPPQEWTVPDRIPTGKTTLFSGEGAAGKSLIQLHLSVAHALGRMWLGTTPCQGPALFVDAEDDEKVIHKRLYDILFHYQARFADVQKNLHLVSLAGEEAVLGFFSRRSYRIEETTLYDRLFEMAGDLKPRMIGIASSADVFAGNEIDRCQVQQFIGLLTRLAMVANGSVVLISHPSLTGINTGTGISGTTQWHNSVRARFYLRGVKSEDEQQGGSSSNVRELVFMKNNYGPISTSIAVQYQGGLFLPVVGTTFDAAAKSERAQDIFLKLLERFNKENRKVSANAGPGYAPSLFVKEHEARSVTCSKEELADAMRALLRVGRIIQQPYGKPSNQHHKLVVNTYASGNEPI